MPRSFILLLDPVVLSLPEAEDPAGSGRQSHKQLHCRILNGTL